MVICNVQPKLPTEIDVFRFTWTFPQKPYKVLSQTDSKRIGYIIISTSAIRNFKAFLDLTKLTF